MDCQINEKKSRSRSQKHKKKSGLKTEKSMNQRVKSEEKGHTHYPVPSNVSWSRRAIELEENRYLHAYIMLQRLYQRSIRED